MSRRTSPGPYGPPSSTSWRRERLIHIGSTSNSVMEPAIHGLNDHPPADTTVGLPTDVLSDRRSLLQSASRNSSYGTLPLPTTHRRLVNKRSLNLLNPNEQELARNHVSDHSSPAILSPSFFRASVQRPISAYDAALNSRLDPPGTELDPDAKTNGIRVWYSSFTSIDWLHDAIKDSVRFSRLRRRKSLRSRAVLAFDKSIGWIIVSIVGFLTAFVAYGVVRSEQWLFDLKEGYCLDGWFKAKRLCCPPQPDSPAVPFFFSVMLEEVCPSWRIWGDVFDPSKSGRGTPFQKDFIEYIAYAITALTLAFVSCFLTLNLTASTSFVTRKESGVFSPNFSKGSDSKNATDNSTGAMKRKVMYYAAGSGIPEIKTILSGFVIHGYLGGRVLFTKSVGLALSVASGLSLGKEGPFVHIASCIGNIVSRFVSKYENNEGKRREILSAACAAGVAVAFGAPIGGTLFSLEEVSYFFPPKVMWRSFFCAMIAAITLKMLDPFGTGKLVLFQVTYDKDWHAYELFGFLLLGVFGGVYGAYFSKLNFRWSRHVRNGTWLKSHPIAEVLIVTGVTTLLCFLNPYTRMGGTEFVANLFAECRTGSRNTHSGLCVLDPGSFDHIWPVVGAILVAMVVKGALTIVTFGIKVPAGIFIPTLGVGACAGRILGIGMQWLQWKYPRSRAFEACQGDLDCVIPGLYAMVGAAATLSGVTRTTVSLAVIMFELTDTLTYAIPVMLAVLVAKTVADALEPKGIYDLVIELSQLPYLDAKVEYLWGKLQIIDATDREVDVIRVDRMNTVESLRDLLCSSQTSGRDDGGFPIIKEVTSDGGSKMIGYIGVNELEHALSIVAEDGGEEVHFHTAFARDLASSSISSLNDQAVDTDPFDFSVYMDQAPLMIQSHSPLQLLHQFFVKLGARYVIVTDTEGFYEGVIDKKKWLAFLGELEEKS